MEANVEPKQDPDLKIEWFLNGKVLEQAHRYKTTYDFGLVTLDLNDAYDRDQGIYTCRAFNKVSESVMSHLLSLAISLKVKIFYLRFGSEIHVIIIFHDCRSVKLSAPPRLLWAARMSSLRARSILLVKLAWMQFR